MINFPEIREGDNNFKRYMGHDTLKIEDRKLVRIFPIYTTYQSSLYMINPIALFRKQVIILQEYKENSRMNTIFKW
jgi:hypothetical protein